MKKIYAKRMTQTQKKHYKELMALCEKVGFPTILEIRDAWGYSKKSIDATYRMLRRLEEGGFAFRNTKKKTITFEE